PTVIHSPLDRIPAGDRVVAVDLFAGDPERLATGDDRAFAMLAAGRSGNSPAVVGDHDQYRQLVAGPSAPDQARSEVAFGGPRVAPGDDGDAIAAMPFLHEGSARCHDVLNLNDRAGRNHVPFAPGKMAGEITAHRMRIGRRHAHLTDSVE